MISLADYIVLEKELCRRSFRYFIQTVQSDYIFNWHHEEIIAACQELAERKTINRLIVMVPPRHGKSQIVSRLFPAWLFCRNINEQIITASYSDGLASQMNRDCQRIMSGDKYAELWPKIALTEKRESGTVQNSKRFDIGGGKGYYMSAGVGGGITGAGCTVGIIDDPVKNSEEADSATYRNKAWEWYTTTFKTRFEPGCIEVICQTRWHEDDLTGRILAGLADDGKTRVISFPAISEIVEKNRGVNEALWPGKYNLQSLQKTMVELGSRAWTALFQQKPAPADGGLIKKAWFSYYDLKKFEILPTDRVNFYFDTAYTDKEKNDPCAGIAYIKRGADHYVLECLDKWLDFTDQTEWIKTFTEDNGYNKNTSLIRVEPKATGKSLVQVLRKQTGLNIKEGAAPKESKIARVNSCSAVIEAGRVFLPMGANWVPSFLDQCASFPNAAHDDKVDCLTGMIISERQPKPHQRAAH
jgi:predicted phage terminase large subunit-like protein